MILMCMFVCHEYLCDRGVCFHILCTSLVRIEWLDLQIIFDI